MYFLDLWEVFSLPQRLCGLQIGFFWLCFLDLCFHLDALLKCVVFGAPCSRVGVGKYKDVLKPAVCAWVGGSVNAEGWPRSLRSSLSLFSCAN